MNIHKIFDLFLSPSLSLSPPPSLSLIFTPLYPLNLTSKWTCLFFLLIGPWIHSASLLLLRTAPSAQWAVWSIHRLISPLPQI